MKKLQITLLGIILFFASHQVQSQNCLKVGVNGWFFAWWVPDFPFVNDFPKNMGMMTTYVNGGSWNDGFKIPIDSDGYPLQIPYNPPTDNPDKGPLKARYIILAQPSNARLLPGGVDNDYVVLFDGDGDLEFERSTKIKPGSTKTIYTDAGGKITGGRYVINQFNNDDFGNLLITRSEFGNHVRNIRVLLPGSEATYKTNWVNPEFKKKLEPFTAFRFMDWGQTNFNSMVNWEDRNKVSSSDWIANSRGIPYEAMAKMCNETRKAPWVNIPHAASDDYIRKMAQLFLDSLDSDLDIYVEYSNELWNSSFGQWGWCYAIDPTDWGSQEIARRYTNAYRIWKDVWKKDSARLTTIISSGSSQIVWAKSWCGLIDPKYYDAISTTWYCHDANAWRGQVRNDILGFRALAKNYNKKLLGYEGGNETASNNAAQGALMAEMIDSCAAYGFSLVNYYTAFDANLGNSWGMLGHAWQDEKTSPEYMGVVSKIQKCYIKTATTDLMGSGMALRMDGYNDYANITSSYIPANYSDNYSVEAWVSTDGMGYEQSIWSFTNDASGLNAAYNILNVNITGQINWKIGQGSNPAVNIIGSSNLVPKRWYHVTAVKNGNEYRLYSNGIEIAYASVTLNGTTGYNRFTLGGIAISPTKTTSNFKGYIDEVRVWNTSLSSITNIRNWMCKKITSTHPNYTNLRGYFQCDEVNANVLKNSNGTSGSLQNFTNVEKPAYDFSGAPIGNESVNLYTKTWANVGLSYTHAQGDQFNVSNLGAGNPEGVHIYMVNGKSTADLPLNYNKFAENRYFGVFVAGGTTTTYDIAYKYTGNSSVTGPEDNLRTLKRQDNSIRKWTNAGAELIADADLLSVTCKEFNRAEYAIAMRSNTGNKKIGAGNAIKLDNSKNQFLRIPARLEGNFTISFWAKGSGTLLHLYNYSKGSTWIKLNADNTKASITSIPSAGGWGLMPDNMTTNWDVNPSCPSGVCSQIIANTYNHYAFVFNRTSKRIDLYLNGILTVNGTINNFDLDNYYDVIDVGSGNGNGGSGYFNGEIDELTIWNTNLSSSDIRDWMCKKVNKTHPKQCKDLLVYFNFDEESGIKVFEDFRGGSDATLFGGNANMVRSGAHVGDVSVNNYSTPSSLSLSHPAGDAFSVKSFTNGNPTGLHIYRVDGDMNPTLPYPAGVLSHDITRFWGVFCANATGTTINTFTAEYNFTGNPVVSNAAEMRLSNRKDNSVATILGSATPTGSIISATGMNYINNGEYILTGSTANSFKTNPPQVPSAIIGPTQLCAGQLGISYEVNAIDGVQFIWSFPQGFSFSSTSNKVTVSLAANAVSGTISVYTVNQFGQSTPSSINVTVNSTINADVLVSGSTVCKNSAGTLTIKSSQTGVEYQAYLNATAVGSKVNGNGSDAIITIPAASLSSSAENSFTIQASQGTCNVPLINSGKISVSPKTSLVVEAPESCPGIDAAVRILNSELQVNYTIYNAAGTTAISETVAGGGHIELYIPAASLISGNNTFKIKAEKTACSETFFDQNVIVKVKTAPQQKQITLSPPIVCLDETPVTVKIANSELGVTYDYIYKGAEIRKETLGTGNDLLADYKINPFSGYTSMGTQLIFVKATKDGCSVMMTDTAQSLYLLHGKPRQDFHFNKLATQSGATVCAGDNSPTPMAILNAALGGYQYMAYVNGVPASIWYESPGGVDDGSYSITFDISPSFFTQASNTVKVFYRSCDMTGFLDGESTVTLNSTVQSPDKNLQVTGGGAICPGQSTSITIANAQANTSYTPVIASSGIQLANTITNGSSVSNLTINVPSTILPVGLTEVKIMVKNAQCPTTSLTALTSINVITPNTSVVALGDTICGTADANITIVKSETGVRYEAYINGGATGAIITGNGNNVQLIVPNNLLPNNFTTIQVRANATGCAGVELSTKPVVVKINVPSPLVVDLNYSLNDPAPALTAIGNNLQWYLTETGGTGVTTAPTPSTAAAGITSYYVTQSAGSCESSRARIDVTISGNSAGILSPDDTTICSGSSLQLFLSGNSGSILRWESSVNSGSSWQNIPNTTSTHIANNITSAIQFRVVVQGQSGEIFSNVSTVSISAPAVGGSISATQTTLAPGKNTALNLTGYTRDIIRWEYIATPFVGTWKDTIITLPFFVTQNLYAATRFRAVVQSGVCPVVTSSYIQIDVIPNEAGTVTGGTTVCVGQNGATLSLTGYKGTIIRWKYSEDPFTTTHEFPFIDPNYTTSPLSKSTIFWAVVVGLTGDTLSSIPDTIEVVAPPVSGTISGNNLITINTTTNLSLSTSTGNIATWQASTSPYSIWNNLPSTQGLMNYTTSALTASTAYRVIVTSSTCPSDTSNEFIVNVFNSDVGTLVSTVTGNICAGNSIKLTLHNTSGTVVEWQQSSSVTGPWNTIIGITDTVFNTGAILSTTYYKVVVRLPDLSTPESNILSIIVDQPSNAGTLAATKTSVCQNENTSLTVTGNTGTLQWITSFDGSIWNNISGNSSTINTPPLTTMQMFAVIATNGICLADTGNNVSITVEVAPASFSALGDTICSGSNATLSLQSTEANAIYNVYNSSSAIVATETATLNTLNITVLTAQNGLYSIVASTANGCKGTPVQVNIEVISITAPVLIGERIVCPDTTILYSLQQIAGHSYSITVIGGTIISQTDLSNIEINWTNNGSIIINDTSFSAGCAISETIDISVGDRQAPVIQCPENIVLIVPIDSILDKPYNYLTSDAVLKPRVSDKCNGIVISNDYNQSYSLSNDTIVFQYLEGTTSYIKTINWTATDIEGLESSCQVIITVEVDIDLTPYTAFSPNNDGINDTWVIRNIDQYPDATVRIYNRWGNKIFEKKGYSNDWNGIINSKELPIDSYHFIILINNTIIKRGIVTLIR